MVDHLPPSWLTRVTDYMVYVVRYFNAGAMAILYAHFGQGSGTIYLDDVACTGSESRLIDCTYDPDTSDCNHGEDAGIRCIPSEIVIKLAIVYTHNLGSTVDRN